MAVIMTLVVGALAVFNYNREVRDMEKVLGEKGEALIRSFEAGARAGMMGSYGAQDRLQALIDATAELPDIRFILLTDREGRVIAHNDEAKIGSTYLGSDQIRAMSPGQQARWMIMEDGDQADSFVVYKEFVSLGTGGSRMMHQMMGHHMMGAQERAENTRWGMNGAETAGKTVDRPLIFIGLDTEPFIEARQTDVRVMIMTSGVLLLVGLGCMISLFWVQAYRRSRQQLKDSQIFASEIVAHLPIGLVVTGPDDIVTHINGDAASLLGVEAEIALHQNVNDVLPAAIVELASESSGMKGPITKELQVSSGDKCFPGNIGVAQVVSDEGLSLGAIFILSDLTEIHRLQAEMKQREKMAAIGNLAAGIAHEVRNPLSSIKGYATYFAGLFDEDSDNRKAAMVMIAETERLNRVISELLDFSRPSEISPKEVDMAFVMDTVSRLFQQDATDLGIEVVIDVQSDLPPVKLDADRMIQALLNMGINAIQAMDAGGRLTLRVLKSDTDLIIQVEDTGHGIAEENMATVFDPYFTTKSQGTGLGLAVVRKIVEGHGGYVDFASSVGNGTTFTISLPQST
ncbi:ATP-binding protein [Pseudodesulfovibrio cashew]|nr:ATP-binding protein [Pseudodesulfovibrio cashew]